MVVISRHKCCVDTGAIEKNGHHPKVGPNLSLGLLLDTLFSSQTEERTSKITKTEFFARVEGSNLY